jgi:hypothetical protein
VAHYKALKSLVQKPCHHSLKFKRTNQDKCDY